MDRYIGYNPGNSLSCGPSDTEEQMLSNHSHVLEKLFLVKYEEPE